jgi:hypothetical protein
MKSLREKEKSFRTDFRIICRIFSNIIVIIDFKQNELCTNCCIEYFNLMWKLDLWFALFELLLKLLFDIQVICV